MVLKANPFAAASIAVALPFVTSIVTVSGQGRTVIELAEQVEDLGYVGPS